VFHNNSNRATGVNPRAIVVDNNTVILQSAVSSSSSGHQSIPSTVIVQAPPSSSPTIGVVSSNPSRTFSDGTSVTGTCSTPVVGVAVSSTQAVIPTAFLKRRPEGDVVEDPSQEEPADKKPKIDNEVGGGDELINNGNDVDKTIPVANSTGNHSNENDIVCSAD